MSAMFVSTYEIKLYRFGEHFFGIVFVSGILNIGSVVQNFQWVNTQLACRSHKHKVFPLRKKIVLNATYLLKGHDATCARLNLCLYIHCHNFWLPPRFWLFFPVVFILNTRSWSCSTRSNLWSYRRIANDNAILQGIIMQAWM